MSKFPKRLYANFAEFRADIGYITARRPLIRATMRGGLVSFAFRERLMMMVTQVNGCRYCSYFHAKEAAKAGISEVELRALLDGQIPEDAPADELPALVYAQHWAESNAQPQAQAITQLKQVYGIERAEAIHLVLRMIRVGNLLGNTWDYVLFRLGLLKVETGLGTGSA
ncbi:MAG: carboxymuconolactone decarboxylase family protein [Anaerolineae bacterium]|nr:carboxymuconolactone decarboxylase family protein [Anaerolineae bacterium]